MNVEEMLVRVDTLCLRLENLLAELQKVPQRRPSPYPKPRETYPNAGKPWSAAEDEALAQLSGEGLSVAEIASRCGRTQNGIRQRLERLGIAA